MMRGSPFFRAASQSESSPHGTEAQRRRGGRSRSAKAYRGSKRKCTPQGEHPEHRQKSPMAALANDATRGVKSEYLLQMNAEAARRR